jgi:predicted metal-dependent phosphotriesterase family hydrolase
VDVNGVRDNVLLDDPDLAIAEIQAHADEGGGGVVDVTLEDIGRDRSVLRRASEETGLT